MEDIRLSPSGLEVVFEILVGSRRLVRGVQDNLHCSWDGFDVVESVEHKSHPPGATMVLVVLALTCIRRCVCTPHNHAGSGASWSSWYPSP